MVLCARKYVFCSQLVLAETNVQVYLVVALIIVLYAIVSTQDLILSDSAEFCDALSDRDVSRLVSSLAVVFCLIPYLTVT